MLQGHPHVDYVDWVIVWHWENWVLAAILILVGAEIGYVVRIINGWLRHA